MKDIVTVSTVNFSAVWGDSLANGRRLAEYTEALARRGSDIIVFPESALTGYDVETEPQEREQLMQRRLAETVPGPSSDRICALARKYGVYVVFGLAERDAADQSKVYNSAAVCQPDGRVEVYRKIHLPFSEQKWADQGENPLTFETPWGPVGLAICYDFYCFPEILRHSRALGARLFINCTAICTLESGGAGGYTGNVSLEYLVQANSVYVATANLFGTDRTSFFMGGSSIIGPSSRPPEAFFYAGQKFLEAGAAQGTVATATIDLSLTGNSFLAKIWDQEEPDWRPDLYAKWLDDLSKPRDRGR